MTDLTKFRDHCRAAAVLTHKPECPSLAKRLPPPPYCPGCVTDADRELFRKLADEVDAYLAPSTTAPDLFGGASEQGVAS